MSVSEEDFTVRCVRSTRTTSNALTEAYNILTENGFRLEWISEADCFEVKSREKDAAYLFDVFEGDAFLHLAALESRVYGPQCVISCLRHKLQIPRKRKPVYSLAMKDLVVCCSNIGKEAREEIYKKVEYMGGEVHKDLTEIVSHLVVNEIGSKKYFAAGSTGREVMLPEWVNEVWKQSSNRHVHGTDVQFQAFKCPVFKGLVITVSGVPSKERQEIQKLVESEGGRYTGEMKVNECTHLIINQAEGKKYEYAIMWKIAIVKPQWLYDSIAKGYCQEEEIYRTTQSGAASVTTSTPEKKGNLTTHCDPHLVDISSIANVSVISHVNETAMSRKSEVTLNFLNSNGSGNITHSNETTLQIPEPVHSDQSSSVLDSLDLSQIPKDFILDGCKVYLSGFKGPRLEKLKRMLNTLGGTRLNQLNENVTHIIVGEQLDKDLQQIEESPFRPHVVSISWLVESCKSGSMLQEENYAVLNLQRKDPLSPKLSLKKRSKSVEKSEPGTNKTRVSEVQTELPKEAENDDMEDILSQYLLSANAPEDVQKETSKVDIKEVTTDIPDNDTTFQPQDETTDGNNIFSGKTFVSFGFENDQVKALEECILEQGGKCISPRARRIPDYAVVPIMYGPPVKVSVKEVVTNAWVEMCIEEEKLLPVTSNCLFSPLEIRDENSPLQDCVLSISGYAGIERECLVHIAEILGAKCQDFFVRKATKALYPSTHLIVKEAEGSKYAAARKWNLPALDKSWLFACAKSGRKESEVKYDIDTFQSAEADSDEKQTSHIRAESSATPVQKNNKHKKTENLPEQEPETLPEKSSNVNNNSVNHNKVENIRTTSVTECTAVQQMEIDDGQSNVESAIVQKPVTVSTESNVSRKDIAFHDSQKENISSPIVAQIQNPIISMLQTEGMKESAPRSPNTMKKLGIETPSKFLDPNVRYKPNFDFGDFLNNFPSPAPSNNRTRRQSTPLPVLLDRALHIAVENTSKPREVVSTPEVRRKDEVIKAQPLEGVIIAVAKKLCSSQVEYNDIVSDLGGGYKWTYDDSCTHFIFQGKTNDLNKEFRLVREKGKKIVHPQWLFKCKEENARVDESAFPHNYNPNLSLAVVASKRETPARSTRKPRINSNIAASLTEKFEESTKTDSSDENEKKVDDTKESKVENLCEAPDTLEMREEFSKQLENLIPTSKSNKHSRRRSRKLNLSGQLNSSSGSRSDGSCNRPPSRQNRWSGQAEEKQDSSKAASKGKTHSDGSAEPSQSVQVAWDDPTGRLEQEKLAHQLERACSPTQDSHGIDLHDDGIDLHDDAQFSDVENEIPEENRMTSSESPSKKSTRQTPPICIFSGFQPKEKIENTALIERLGGIVLEAQQYDAACTHLIIGKPSRNEKVLACVASGKWVLNTTYLEACKNAGKFVSEEEHEWGNEKMRLSLEGFPPQVSKLARAANRWRVEVQNMKKLNAQCGGAFEGWTVVLCTDKTKEGSFRRLLEAGGADVLPIMPPFVGKVNATHAFLDLNKVNLPLSDLNSLLDSDVKCLRPEYIAAHLTDDPPISFDDYVPNELAGGVKKRKSSVMESRAKRSKKQ